MQNMQLFSRIRKFLNTCKYFDHDNKKFISLSQKGFYLYEYTDDWKKFNETSLPKKQNFYSHFLSIEDITDADYTHAKRVCKDSK